MTSFQRVTVACLLASALLPTAAAHAATYYVAPNGDNNDPGSENEPWRSVAHAVSTMKAGDTTYVKDGTYQEGTIHFRRSGTQAAPIKLLNYPDHSPKIVFNDPEQIHRILIQHSSGHNVAIGWITIEGLELTNGHDGIKWHNLHDSTIRRNWIHHNKFMGMIGIGAARLLIDRNKVNHNGNFDLCAQEEWRCNQHHGIYAHGSDYTVTNNLFYGNLAYGVQQNGSPSSAYDPSMHPSTEFSGAADWLIANNTFAYNANRGGVVVWGSKCTNSRIENNIFYENNVTNNDASPQGIEFVGSSGVTGIKVRNNLAFASGSGGSAFVGSNAPSYEDSGNVTNNNPGFVNAPATLPDSPNFALTAQSPAIDKGVTLAEVTTDFLGALRPQGPKHDIGAYEFAIAGNDAPPAAPTGLQAN